ncbi:MAG: hypothetical protein V3V12_09365 [Gammaproteobacteria bacterium]
MARFFHRLLASTLLAITPHISNADTSDITGLQYGEVLFHFFQDDYYTSLSHLMAAQDRNQINEKQKEAELLRAGLQLSYGLSHEADKQFRQILDVDVDSDTQNTVWYYLGKYAYQHGEFGNAHRYLNKLTPVEGSIENDSHLLLLANTLMMRDKNNEAANLLATSKTSGPLNDYLKINKGIAQLRAGHVKSGEKTLQSFNKKPIEDEELKTLRDQANLGLGFQFIRQEKPKLALTYLEQVRLQGSLSQQALLATGWALAGIEQYQKALTPWLELGQRDSFDTAVQEANLAIPYAFEKLEKNTLAIQYYNRAIDYFLKEKNLLAEAVDEVTLGDWKTHITVNNEKFGNWITGYQDFDPLPARNYLADLLSGHEFQSSIGDYRDLVFLQNQQEKWRHTITLFKDMIETRKKSYNEKAPAAQQRLEAEEISHLKSQLDVVEQRYLKIKDEKDIFGLASDQERQQMKTINAIEQRMNALPDSEKLNKKREKLHWLKGVLYWQVNEAFKQRLWSIRKSLNTVAAEITTGKEQNSRVISALSSSSADFTIFIKQIDSISSRIDKMEPALDSTLLQAEKQLEGLIFSQLKKRNARLASYLTQARYALARNHDLLSSVAP